MEQLALVLQAEQAEASARTLAVMMGAELAARMGKVASKVAFTFRD